MERGLVKVGWLYLKVLGFGVFSFLAIRFSNLISVNVFLVLGWTKMYWLGKYNCGWFIRVPRKILWKRMNKSGDNSMLVSLAMRSTEKLRFSQKLARVRVRVGPVENKFSQRSKSRESARIKIKSTRIEIEKLKCLGGMSRSSVILDTTRIFNRRLTDDLRRNDSGGRVSLRAISGKVTSFVSRGASADSSRL